MERNLKFSIGEYYHIYNRGNNKTLIFLDDNDRKRFQKLLYACNGVNPVVFKTIQGSPLDKIEKGQPLVAIGAYCLMPNHFHILLKEITEGGITKFLGKISTAYSMYFNKKYDRSGRLFENIFRSTHLDTDVYLKYIFSYIHLNPVKLFDSTWKENGIKDRDKAKTFLLNYWFSSFNDYMGINREENILLDRSVFPDYFSSFNDFEDFVNEWLDFKR